MERGRPIAISRVEQGSEDASGWIEGKDLIRKAVYAISSSELSSHALPDGGRLGERNTAMQDRTFYDAKVLIAVKKASPI